MLAVYCATAYCSGMINNKEVQREITTHDQKSTMTVWVHANSAHMGQHGTNMLRVSKQKGSRYTWSMPAEKLGFMPVTNL